MADFRHGMTSRGSFNIGIKMEGQWMKLNRIVSTMPTAVAAAAIETQREFAYKYRDEVEKNIRNGGRRFNYPGHSPKYAAYKRSHGGPGKLLVWGQTMAESVIVQKGGMGRYAVTIDPSATRLAYSGTKDHGNVRVSEYANILEHGTANIPPRPVFSDTFRKDKSAGGMGGIKGLETYMQWGFSRKIAKAII